MPLEIVRDNHLQDASVLAALKRLVAEIEAGEISIARFYFVAYGDKFLDRNGNVTEPFTVGYDSGLTIAEAIYLLEQENFRIMCAAHGIKAPT